MSREGGFSLIELLIVVGIMLIVAAIAIPSLLRSRMAANEASAAHSLKQIGTANTLYSTLYEQGYAGRLAYLGPTSGACAAVSSGCADFLDSALSGVNPVTANPVKSGYRFTYYPANPNPDPANPNPTWAVVATPTGPGSTGVSTFCFDNSNIIWKDSSGGLNTATPAGCAATWPVGGNVGPT